MNGMFKRAVAVLGAAGFVASAGVVVGGCLDRDVVSRPPAVNTVVTKSITNNSIDKVDLLFMIDNSPSMGDKQSLLALAVPNMINRLVTPNCIDANGKVVGQVNNGTCPSGSNPEFKAVHDMHIGIVSSSLGSRGGDVCPDNTPNPVNMALNAHNNDNGELIARSGVAGDPTQETAPPAAAGAPLNFLAYFPGTGGSTNPPAETSATQLVTDFTSLIEGVHEHGCGFESQNEAWYRFLVQPDPFKTIAVNGGKAQLQGVDTTILQQRAAFLRPDSLLAVIVVTDENEEAADPLSISGQGWAFNSSTFPGSQSGGGAAEGTVTCNMNPNDPACTSCAFNGNGSDPAKCPKEGPNGNQGYMDPSLDAINLRFYHQKIRFGVSSAYPTSRYIRGLQKATVPSVGLASMGDSDHEHDGAGNYIGDQDGQANCVNPIYAQNLPTDTSKDLCKLTAGPRTPDLVYYAAIAGVPHQLLQAKPGDKECPSGTPAAQCPQKSVLADTDWQLIMGKDPEHYDFSGADFHMVESPTPRTTNNGSWANVATCSPPAMGRPSATQDPINGCEFDTTLSGAVEDLQFACIFPLVQNAGGTIQAYKKDCTSPQFTNACDCAGASLDNKSQLCDTTTSTSQVYAKAYPSVREMIIAKAMSEEKLSDGTVINQGIVSSLCPINLDVGQPLATANADPLFGYNPAVNAIIDRLKVSLNSQCFSQQLTYNTDVDSGQAGAVSCLVLVALPAGTGGSGTSCSNPGAACSLPQFGGGLIGPSTDPNAQFQQQTLDRFCQDHTTGGVEPQITANQPVCAIKQLILDPNNTTDCSKNAQPGWCYVQGAAASALGCTPPNTIAFSGGFPPQGAQTVLECLENAVNVVPDAGGGG